MDFAFTPAQQQLRRNVRQFLIEELGADRTSIGTIERSQAFSKKLAERGWICMTWPKEYGGPGATHLDQLVVMEELIRFGAPLAYHIATDRQVGHSIIKFGTEEQKREFLPKIAKADITFAMLLSEPGGGSDLAGVKCRAVGDGDEFVINGQKIWTGGAHEADYGWLVANTDPLGQRYNNISEFIVDFKKPGVSCTPIIDATGHHQFNAVFFDDYRTSRQYLVGKKNEGWLQITRQVDLERAGIDRLMHSWPVFEALLRYVKEAITEGRPIRDIASVRDKLADLKLRFEAGRWLIYREAWMLSDGKVPNAEAAIAKAYGTSFQQHLATVCVDILGMPGLLRLGSKWAPILGVAALNYMRSPSYTIQGGTSEILRNIIAKRGLGLPSHT